MSTPLLKKFKTRGTSFYAFPSTSLNPNPKFSKFVLLHIPPRVTGEVMDFNLGEIIGNTNMVGDFPIYSTSTNSPSSYGDQMIESLRNYVANHDTVMKESKVNQKNDFYNISEPTTPTEKIFWKWMRKMGALDLEPAEHKVDWNKYYVDFDNLNSDTVTNIDFFRKYLWKEREIIEYVIEQDSIDYFSSLPPYGTNIIKITSYFPMKFKIGDKVILNIDFTLNPFNIDNPFEILGIDESEEETSIYIEVEDAIGEPEYNNASVKLQYHRLIQYIGEINVQSDVKTASKTETEITAYIPHQAGKTPTVMFHIGTDTNYYPGLELPLLPIQIQDEIFGAENLNSPIRQNPGDYPGSWFGQFDDRDKTYKASSGDRIRYSGDYYGILRNNNVGLEQDNYIERLSEFNSDNIDGLMLDFNLNHYLKMIITDSTVGFNFDEFNQLIIDGQPPQDFSYNAILWYYETMGENNEINHNLYGVTFLNNPDEDDDINDGYISPYEKLTQNDEQDGLSYVHVLNLSQSVDNDTSSLSFDPLTLNNTFGFDLYNNVMSNLGKLNESFVNIINEFVRINTDISNVKSLVYSQTDIDLIKNKLKNMEELLRLYSTYQFVESETVKINQDFSGVYPMLSFDVKGVEYGTVISTTTNDVINNMIASQGDFVIDVPETSKMFIRITNNDITDNGSINLLFNRDFNFKQSATIYLDANDALYSGRVNIFMNYNNGTSIGVQKVNVINRIFTPTDISNYIPNNITYSKVRFISTSIVQNVNLVASTGDTIETAETVLYTPNANIFGDSINKQMVYVQDLIYRSGATFVDFSGTYEITPVNNTPVYVKIKLDTRGLIPFGVPKIYLYKGMKIDIMRVNESPTSSFGSRYLIQRTFI